MDEITTVKGTHDVINDESIAYQEIELAFRELADIYGYGEYKTPVLNRLAEFSVFWRIMPLTLKTKLVLLL